MCMCNPNLRTTYCPRCSVAWMERQKDVPVESYTSKVARAAYQGSIDQSQDIIGLRSAGVHAHDQSDCEKVAVGAMIRDIHGRVIYGANRVLDGVCTGVQRCQVEGHCVSTIHAEIDAIAKAGRDLYGAVLYVTRYPCEACARAIVVAGIKTVVYGRSTKMSSEAEHILGFNRVIVRHVPEYKEADFIAGQPG